MTPPLSCVGMTDAEYAHAQQNGTTPMNANGVSFRGPCESQRLCLVSESSKRRVQQSQW